MNGKIRRYVAASTIRYRTIGKIDFHGTASLWSSSST